MSRIIYFDGKFVDESKAVIPVTAHALHYGTGCFEGIRAYYNQNLDSLYIFRMEDHYRRFLESCNILFIDLEKTVDELCQITKELVAKNFIQTDMYIRPLAFKSDPAVGNFNLPSLKSSLVIYTTPLGRHLNTEDGIKANISSWKRVPDNSIPPRGKITGAYVNTSLAKTESILNGFDEALLLDSDDHIVEGSAENIFMIKNNLVITPGNSSDILVGITRNTIMELMKNELKLEILERNIDRSEIYSADEVLLVGTGAEVTPVIEVDHRKIGNGKIGPISAQLKKIYFDMVHSENDKYMKYLTEIKRS